MSFRPSIPATIVVFTCVFLQFGLAKWQWDRYQAKKERLALVKTTLSAPPLRNHELERADLDWHKVMIKGQFVDQPMFITGRYEFSEPGMDIVQVLKTPENKRYLVNRGWIPLQDWEQKVQGINNSTQTVEGLLMTLNNDQVRQGFRTGCAGVPSAPIAASDNLPERWAAPAYAHIAKGLEGNLEPYVIVAGQELIRGVKKNRKSYPVTGYIPRPKHVPHLEYSLQWLGIAGVFLAGWVISGVRRAKALAEVS